MNVIPLASDLVHQLHRCVESGLSKNKKELRFDESGLDCFYEQLLPAVCHSVHHFVADSEEKKEALQASMRYFFSDHDRIHRLFHSFAFQDESIVQLREKSFKTACERLKQLDDRLDTDKQEIKSQQGIIQANGVASLDSDLLHDICMSFIEERVFSFSNSILAAFSHKPKLKSP